MDDTPETDALDVAAAVGPDGVDADPPTPAQVAVALDVLRGFLAYDAAHGLVLGGESVAFLAATVLRFEFAPRGVNFGSVPREAWTVCTVRALQSVAAGIGLRNAVENGVADVAVSVATGRPCYVARERAFAAWCAKYLAPSRNPDYTPRGRAIAALVAAGRVYPLASPAAWNAAGAKALRKLHAFHRRHHDAPCVFSTTADLLDAVPAEWRPAMAFRDARGHYKIDARALADPFRSRGYAATPTAVESAEILAVTEDRRVVGLAVEDRRVVRATLRALRRRFASLAAADRRRARHEWAARRFAFALYVGRPLADAARRAGADRANTSRAWTRWRKTLDGDREVARLVDRLRALAA